MSQREVKEFVNLAALSNEGIQVDDNASLELKTALIELEITKKRIINEKEYYDEESDKKNIQDYYHQIDFDAGDNKELYRRLNQLITITHENQLPYNATTRAYLYSRVDLQLDGKLKSVYSGKVKEPEQVIKEDFETERIRAEAYSKLLNSVVKSDDDIQQGMAAIKSKNMYNTEHVVPQSWFDRKNPMKGDLHHLFTCEKDCNSLRSNYPYYDFVDYPPKMEAETIKMHCGKSEKQKFEPESGKGEVARATLYFLLRFPGKISRYRNEDIEMLIQWHHEFDVSIYEKRRNKEIFDIQKNRNPLIDFPQHIDKIDFALGLSQ